MKCNYDVVKNNLLVTFSIGELVSLIITKNNILYKLIKS